MFYSRVSMAISYQFKVIEDNILFVKTTGFDRDLDDAKNYGIAIINKAVECNTPKILCDEMELEYRLSIVETFQLAKYISKNTPAYGKLAIVTNKVNKFAGDFFANAGNNRGLTINFFSSVDRAKDWLNS